MVEGTISPPDSLVKALGEGDCVLFAGPGLNVGAGSPSTKAVLEALLQFSLRQGLIESSLTSTLRSALETGQYAAVAEAVVSRGWKGDSPSPELVNLLRQMFSAFESQRLPRIYGKLRRLPFCAAITSNYDNLFRRAFESRIPEQVFTSKDSRAIHEAMVKREFFVLYLWGSLQEPSTLVFGEDQYSELITENPKLSEFLQAMSVSRSYLFLGCTLESIEFYLRSISARFAGSREHFALVSMPDEPSSRLRADALKRRYNVSVLPLQHGPEQRRLSQFLDEVAARIAFRAEETNKTPHRPPHFKCFDSVTLRNIGAFVNTTISLHEGWNVLLGGNGVGKSTVLRAIALALCGDTAAPFAARLLRSGQSTGSIALKAGREEYVVELRQNSDSSVDMKSFPPRSVENESRLVVAFPALRSTVRSTVSGPKPRALPERPSVNDVLPILAGDSDHRFDDIKQWVVNLDYRAKSAQSEGVELLPEAVTLNDFFATIGQIATGLTLQFSGVDSETHEVRVHTSDGLVPIDVLSQGTASLLGWIGVLIQRLRDVGGTNSLSAMSGVVLIDELDAHMHPLWQRTIVETLKKIFPLVQFIATSHSPLVVADLSPEEIIAFTRDLSGVHVENPPIDTRGMRADQILTSPLFDLDGTRAPAIERSIERYTQLTTQTVLTEDEAGELMKLADFLKVRLPSAFEKEEARKASGLIENAVQEKLRSMSEEERNRVVRELQTQVQEAITGSRRPE